MQPYTNATVIPQVMHQPSADSFRMAMRPILFFSSNDNDRKSCFLKTNFGLLRLKLPAIAGCLKAGVGAFLIFLGVTIFFSAVSQGCFFSGAWPTPLHLRLCGAQPPDPDRRPGTGSGHGSLHIDAHQPHPFAL